MTRPGTLAWALTMSYNMALWHFRHGTIDENDWHLFQFYWRNSAPRFSSVAEEYQIHNL